MRARTLEPARPSIFDALGEKYTELDGPEPQERPRRKRNSRFAGVTVLFLAAAGAALYLIDAAGSPPRQEVGEISLFQPATDLPPGVEVPAPRATKARPAPPLPPVERPAEAEPARERDAEPPPPPSAVPAPAPAVEAPPAVAAADPEPPAVELAEEPLAMPEAPEDVPPRAAEPPVAAPQALPPPTAAAEPVEPAVKLYSPPPSYPQAEWVAAVEGDVSLLATIGADGRVAGVEVVQGVSPGLDAAAVEAIRRWRYRPATRGGHPVASSLRLTFRFRR